MGTVTSLDRAWDFPLQPRPSHLDTGNSDEAPTLEQVRKRYLLSGRDPFAALYGSVSAAGERRIEDISEQAELAIYEHARRSLANAYHESDIRREMVPQPRCIPSRPPVSASEVRDWIRTPRAGESACSNQDSCFFKRTKISGAPAGGFQAVAWVDQKGLFVDTHGKWNLAIHVPGIVTRSLMTSMFSVRVNEPNEWLLEYTVPRTAASTVGLPGPVPYFRPNLLRCVYDADTRGYRVDISRMVAGVRLAVPWKLFSVTTVTDATKKQKGSDKAKAKLAARKLPVVKRCPEPIEPQANDPPLAEIDSWYDRYNNFSHRFNIQVLLKKYFTSFPLFLLFEPISGQPSNDILERVVVPHLGDVDPDTPLEQVFVHFVPLGFVGLSLCAALQTHRCALLETARIHVLVNLASELYVSQHYFDCPISQIGDASMQLRRLARVEIQRYYVFASHCLSPDALLEDREISITWQRLSPLNQLVVHEKALPDLTDELVDVFVAKGSKASVSSPFGTVLSKVKPSNSAFRKIDNAVTDGCKSHPEFLAFYKNCVLLTRLGLYSHCETDWTCAARPFDEFMEVYGSLLQRPDESVKTYLARTEIADKEYCRLVLNEFMHFIMSFSLPLVDALDQLNDDARFTASELSTLARIGEIEAATAILEIRNLEILPAPSPKTTTSSRTPLVVPVVPLQPQDRRPSAMRPITEFFATQLGRNPNVTQPTPVPAVPTPPVSLDPPAVVRARTNAEAPQPAPVQLPKRGALSKVTLLPCSSIPEVSWILFRYKSLEYIDRARRLSPREFVASGDGYHGPVSAYAYSDHLLKQVEDLAKCYQTMLVDLGTRQHSKIAAVVMRGLPRESVVRETRFLFAPLDNRTERLLQERVAVAKYLPYVEINLLHGLITPEEFDTVKHRHLSNLGPCWLSKARSDKEAGLSLLSIKILACFFRRLFVELKTRLFMPLSTRVANRQLDSLTRNVGLPRGSIPPQPKMVWLQCVRCNKSKRPICSNEVRLTQSSMAAASAATGSSSAVPAMPAEGESPHVVHASPFQPAAASRRTGANTQGSIKIPSSNVPGTIGCRIAINDLIQRDMRHAQITPFDFTRTTCNTKARQPYDNKDQNRATLKHVAPTNSDRLMCEEYDRRVQGTADISNEIDPFDTGDTIKTPYASNSKEAVLDFILGNCNTLNCTYTNMIGVAIHFNKTLYIQCCSCSRVAEFHPHQRIGEDVYCPSCALSKYFCM